MTPKSNPSNQGEENYNSAHSRTRAVVERALGVCKSRFRYSCSYRFLQKIWLKTVIFKDIYNMFSNNYFKDCNACHSLEIELCHQRISVIYIFNINNKELYKHIMLNNLMVTWVSQRTGKKMIHLQLQVAHTNIQVHQPHP